MSTNNSHEMIDKINEISRACPRVVIQRVKQASVSVDGHRVSAIGPGILTLLGIGKEDDDRSLAKLIAKIVNLRIFADEQGKMARSLRDTGYEHLIVPQFTLVADCHAGRRPSFANAAAPEQAERLYLSALAMSQAQGVATYGGVFQANMQVALVNDGPVTFLL